MIKFINLLLAFFVLNTSSLTQDANSKEYEDPDTSQVQFSIGIMSNHYPATIPLINWFPPSSFTFDSLVLGKNLWYKAIVPKTKYAQPALYFYSFLYEFDMYIDTMLILHDIISSKRNQSFRQYIIPLKPEYAGKPIYIRIPIQDLFFIGEIKDLKFGNINALTTLKEKTESTLAAGLVLDSILCGLLLFISIFSMLIFISKRELKLYPFFVFSILALCSAIGYTAKPVSTIGLFGLNYGNMQRLSVFSIFVLAPVFIYFIKVMFGDGWKRIFLWLLIASSVYSVVFVATIFIDNRYTAWFPDTQITFMAEILLLAVAFIGSGYVKKQSIAVILGVGLFLGLSFYDLMGPSTESSPDFSFSGVGVLFLALSLSQLIMKYYQNTQEAYVRAQNLVKQKEIQMELLKEENLRSQYEALKNQINPHFLFNSFSTLISLIEEAPDQAAGFVQKLSNVYRYVLTTQDKQLVKLSDEIEFTKAYTYLLGKRFSDGLHIEISISDEALKCSIIPLAMQMLIENAVKHNIVSHKMPLRVLISTNDENTYLTVSNNLQKKNLVEHSTRIGIKNIKLRYAYYTNAAVIIEEDGEKFSISLPLIRNSL